MTVRGELVRRHPDVAWVEGEQRVVVCRLDRLDRPPAVLNGSAAAIWLALDRASTVEQVVQEVAARYDVDLAVVVDDVEGWLVDACRLGLAVREPAS